jgi:hypothetical protein
MCSPLESQITVRQPGGVIADVTKAARHLAALMTKHWDENGMRLMLQELQAGEHHKWKETADGRSIYRSYWAQ